MLELSGISSGYGKALVLRDVSLSVRPGEIMCLFGRNGAGKTTTLKTIMGLLPLEDGVIRLDGEEISSLAAHEVPKRGIGYVPQGRRLFADLSVAENIEVGLLARGQVAQSMGETKAQTKEWVLELFPRLRERMKQSAETLSGGEQQMLATARALCLRPKVLLLDEPTEGLQPSMIEAIRDVVRKMRAENVGVLLVEQRLDAVMSLADRVAFLENGRMGETLTPDELKGNAALVQRYVGV